MIGGIDSYLPAEIKKVFPALETCVNDSIPLFPVCKLRKSDGL